MWKDPSNVHSKVIITDALLPKPSQSLEGQMVPQFLGQVDLGLRVGILMFKAFLVGSFQKCFLPFSFRNYHGSLLLWHGQDKGQVLGSLQQKES